MRDATEDTFEAMVVARSRQVPVVVDFWASWCGPCRVLGPVIEREVAALGGRVELVKVDTDANPGLAQAFAIQGIPAVKAFRDGAVVDEFVGAQPVSFLRPWLARLAPSDGVVQLAEAKLSLGRGDRPAAIAALRGLLGDGEVGAQAAFALAHALVETGAAEEALHLTDRIPESDPLADRIPALRTLARFVAHGLGAGDEASCRAAAQDAENHDARYALAGLLAGRAAFEEACELLLDLVARRSRNRGAEARQAMLAVFDHLGPTSDLARDVRRRLQIVS